MYINDLAEKLPDSNVNCLFADDVSILATHRDKEQALKEAQRSVNIVIDWCSEWMLSHNAGQYLSFSI